MSLFQSTTTLELDPVSNGPQQKKTMLHVYPTSYCKPPHNNWSVPKISIPHFILRTDLLTSGLWWEAANEQNIFTTGGRQTALTKFMFTQNITAQATSMILHFSTSKLCQTLSQVSCGQSVFQKRMLRATKGPRLPLLVGEKPRDLKGSHPPESSKNLEWQWSVRKSVNDSGLTGKAASISEVQRCVSGLTEPLATEIAGVACIRRRRLTRRSSSGCAAMGWQTVRTGPLRCTLRYRIVRFDYFPATCTALIDPRT